MHNVTLHEAKIIYNKRQTPILPMAENKRKNIIKKKTSICAENSSVYDSLSGVTSARSWKKVK